MEHLEKLRATLEADLQATVDQRRYLEMGQLFDDFIMAQYEGLRDVLDRADGCELNAPSYLALVKHLRRLKVVLRIVTIGTCKHHCGGIYEY